MSKKKKAPHEVLGVKVGASADEIKAAYRAIVKRCHPDLAGDESAAKFQEVQEAYDALCGRDKATIDNELAEVINCMAGSFHSVLIQLIERGINPVEADLAGYLKTSLANVYKNTSANRDKAKKKYMKIKALKGRFVGEPARYMEEIINHQLSRLQDELDKQEHALSIIKKAIDLAAKLTFKKEQRPATHADGTGFLRSFTEVISGAALPPRYYNKDQSEMDIADENR